jgi:hypothetical protein
MLRAAVTRDLTQKVPVIRHSKACQRTQELTCIMAGFAAGFDMAGVCATATSAPAVSPGPSGGTEITCRQIPGPSESSGFGRLACPYAQRQSVCLLSNNADLMSSLSAACDNKNVQVQAA